MGYASRSGRAITNPSAPRAFGVCDHCGLWYNLYKLKYEYEWQGTKLVNKRFRVCDECRDRPNPQLKARIMPPDPVPVYDPRPEPYLFPRNISVLATEGGMPIGTERGPGNYPAGLPMEVPQ
jgi:hypothetical protein